MKAKFIRGLDPKDSMDIGNKKDRAIQRIKEFCDKNNYKMTINKNGTPGISIDVEYPMIKSYDQLQWPVLVKNIVYTITFTDQEQPISLRKVWYGYEPNSIHYWGIYPDEKKFQKMYKEMPVNYKIKNLKQSLMGRFNIIDEALERIQLSMKKELNK